MKYIKLYEQHNESITFKDWLKKHPQHINTYRIDCQNSNLIDIEGIQKFKNLNFLYCDYNNLTSLPELPDSLELLSCSYNNLKELPELPDSLVTLSFSNNNLTELSDLPDSLKFLYCSDNKLTELPKLPDSLIYLQCYNNNLPYKNLEEYKEWHKKTYPYIYKAKNYNI